MSMGIKSASLFFLLGCMMNGIFGPGGQGLLALALPDMRVEQVGNTTRQLPMEMAQRDESVEAEKKESLQPEQKKATPEAATPKTSTGPKEGPPKDFVPSEKIPADQAVDFPTDI